MHTSSLIYNPPRLLKVSKSITQFPINHKMDHHSHKHKERIAIIGTGWAGYALAHGLDLNKFSVIVVSPDTTSTMTPLLASVACGLFDFRLAQEPIRHKSRGIKYIKAWVIHIDFEEKTLSCYPAFSHLTMSESNVHEFQVHYDKVVIAPGTRINTFNIPGVEEHAYVLKKVADAQAIRNRISEMFEMASIPNITEDRQRQLLNVIIVGGGPTGIEMAGELTDLFQNDYSELYPHLRDKMRVSVHTISHKILSPYDAHLQEYATESLNRNSVWVKFDSHITSVTADTIETQDEGRIGYGLLLWATGDKSVPLVDSLDVSKTSHSMHRILTDSRLRVLKKDGTVDVNSYALGDAADIDGESLPPTAEVALQKADYLIYQFNTFPTSDIEPGVPFRYKQRQLVTYTGRRDGVVAGKKDYSGYGAWLSWRSGNLMWTRSWRRKFMICATWVLNWLGGRDIARN